MRKAPPEARTPIEDYANQMRLAPTKWELELYNALLGVFRPYKATVRAQEPIGPYIADFFIAPCNIVVEVDGASHHTPDGKRKDAKRDAFMRQKNIRVMRFKNRQITRNSTACATYVLNQCLPLQASEDRFKVTYCPPGSGFKRRTKGERNLFWKS